MTEKQFTNQQLKYIILDLYKLYNLTITEELNKYLNKSSKTHYNKLLIIYKDIKNYIVNNVSTTSSNDNVNDHIEIIKTEIETQTDIINEDHKQNEIIELKTELFNLKKDLADYKFKCMNYKIEIKKINNKKFDISNNITSSDDETYFKEHRKIKYTQLPELSSYNLIQELKKLSQHELKVLYNRYFSSKLTRKLD